MADPLHFFALCQYAERADAVRDIEEVPHILTGGKFWRFSFFQGVQHIVDQRSLIFTHAVHAVDPRPHQFDLQLLCQDGAELVCGKLGGTIHHEGGGHCLFFHGGTVYHAIFCLASCSDHFCTSARFCGSDRVSRVRDIRVLDLKIFPGASGGAVPCQMEEVVRPDMMFGVKAVYIV